MTSVGHRAVATVEEIPDSGEAQRDSSPAIASPLLRRFLSDAGWMGIVVLVPLVARLLATPIRVRLLSPADFGDVSLWAAIVSVTGGFALWPGTGLMRYFASGDERARAQVLRSWLVATLGTAVAGSLALAAWAIRGGSGWAWVALVAALEILIGGAVSYARASGRFAALGLISLTGSLGSIACGTLLIDPLGPVGVLIGWAAADVLALVVALCLFSGTIVSALRAGSGWQLGRLVRFSAPLAVSNGVWMLVTWLDRPLLSGLVTRSELGLYSLAYALVAAPLAGVFIVISSVTWNHAVTTFEADGYPAAAQLLKRSARIYTATAVPIAVWTAIYGKEILGLLAPESYAGASQHIAWLAVGLWCFGLLPYRNQHLMLWHRTKAAAISPLAALAVNLVTLRLAVPHVGPVGAAVATAAAYGAALAVASWICRRDEKVDSWVPVRLNIACLAISLAGTIALRPAVSSAPGPFAEACALAFVVVAMLAACSIAEGSAWRVFRSRFRVRGVRCAT